MSLINATRRMLARQGRPMTLQRRVGTTAAFSQATTRGTLRAFSPEELVGGVMQGDARIILDAAPLGALAPPRKGDFVVVDGRSWAVLGVHARHIGAAPVAFECWVRGG